jgi:hypothetical protein
VAKQIPSEADRLAAEELDRRTAAPKGHATPTRKEREAANKRPLVGSKTPEARAMSKEQQRVARERQKVGMANGDERYFPVRDRGPQKKFIRDFVDSRWSISELVIPVVAVVSIAGFVFQSKQEQLISTIALYSFVVLVIIDLVIMTVMLRRALTARFGIGKVERTGLYHGTRALQMRVLRLPKPQVKRGQSPTQSR